MNRTNISSGSVWEDEVGYSRAVQVGNRVEVSGTTATGEDGTLVGANDAYEQAIQAIDNIKQALENAGASLDDVVRTRIFVTDISNYDAIARAHSEKFGETKPATSMYEVQRLVDEQMLVEIEASAMRTE